MELIKLGEHVKLSQGLAINAGTAELVSTNRNEEFVYPLLRIADMMNSNYSKYISYKVNKSVVAKEEDIIYTRTGQIGLVFRGFAGVVHNNSFIVKLTDELFDKDYLYMVLGSDFVKKQAISMAKSSVQPDLTHEMFKNISIPYFPIRTQKAIAKIVKEINNKIVVNNTINDNLCA